MATTQQLTVTVTFDDETNADVTNEATYVSDDTDVATVSATGLVTAVSEGTATVTASYEGLSGTSDITVSPAPDPEPESLDVSPPTVTLDHPEE